MIHTRKIDKIITPVDCKYGAPMGRPNKGHILETMGQRLFDCKVPLDSGGYDRGGAYWGQGEPLRVRYSEYLNYICFYRSYYKI